METAQCKRILDLIVYLTCNGQLTTQQYADMLGVTRRNVYNYLKLLSDYGFRVVRNGSRYHLDQRSPFFKQLKENIPLTDTEAEYLCQTLSEADPKDTMASILRAKLARHFGLNDIMTKSNCATPRTPPAPKRATRAMRSAPVVVRL